MVNPKRFYRATQPRLHGHLGVATWPSLHSWGLCPKSVVCGAPCAAGVLAIASRWRPLQSSAVSVCLGAWQVNRCMFQHVPGCGQFRPSSAEDVPNFQTMLNRPSSNSTTIGRFRANLARHRSTTCKLRRNWRKFGCSQASFRRARQYLDTVRRHFDVNSRPTRHYFEAAWHNFDSFGAIATVFRCFGCWSWPDSGSRSFRVPLSVGCGWVKSDTAILGIVWSRLGEAPDVPQPQPLWCAVPIAPDAPRPDPCADRPLRSDVASLRADSDEIERLRHGVPRLSRGWPTW